MPHYKCATCRTRLRVSGAPAELAGNLCPGCGSPLEPAGNLAELIGFRPIQRFAGSAGGPVTGSHRRTADRVDGFIARREELLERQRDLLEAERWLNDDDPVAAAAALPVPQPR